jgi:glycosyltransferase involved in cell wall biosynthesis
MLTINGRFLTVSHPTGTQRASFFLLTELIHEFRDARILCPRKTSFPLPLPKHIEAQVVAQNSLHLHPQLWEQYSLPRYCKDHLFLNLIGTAPFCFGTSRSLMVVHDLNYEIIPKSFSLRFRAWYKLACGKAAQRAKHVFAVSRYTKQQMVERLKIPPEKITVYYQGPGLPVEYLQRPADTVPPEAPTILSVGGLHLFHKNASRMLQAYRLAKQDISNLKMTVVGKKESFFGAMNLGEELLAQEGISYTGYVDDAQLAALYQTSTALLFPSIEEGFGLPIIEAYYAGCPVITSSRSCMPEIAGDGAMLVDPYSIDSIRDAICTLVNDPGTRNELIERGRKRAQDFTWENAARTIADTMRQI